MRLAFWRRKDADATRRDPNRGTHAGARTSHPENPVLAFVRGYLAATGARVRLEGDATLSATLPDGTSTRYTNAPARADAQTQLLAPGERELSRMLDDTAQRARIVWLRLERADDPVKLAGARKGRSVTLTREWEALGVELTYRISARDRSGRTVEWLRVAHDAASGRKLDPLSFDQLERAHQAEPGATGDATLGAASSALAESWEAVRPAIDAAGVFLRQRAADAYRARLTDVRATHERLLREQSEAKRQIAAELERELATLAEVHTVEVRATLESVCLIATPMADLHLRQADGSERQMTLDLGRAEAAPSATESPRSESATPRMEPVAKPRRTPSLPDDSLTVAHLDALTPVLWRECTRWLLERSGYAVEPEGDGRQTGELGDAVTWRGRCDDVDMAALALRPPEGRLIGAAEVRGTAELAAGQAGVRALLISPAATDPEARQLASGLGVELWDREELSALLVRIAEERQVEQMRATRDAKERATAAGKTRTTLLDALGQASRLLDGMDNARTPRSHDTAPAAIGHAALSEAVAELGSIQTAAEQAFLAWETLVGDWLAAFAERPTRAGSLEMTADAAQFRVLRERGAHLGKATRQTCERLHRAPLEGEMGYREWREALIEAYRARMAALMAQIETVDPELWEDADRARGVEGQIRAGQAERTAKAAASRAAKARAQVMSLVRAR